MDNRLLLRLQDIELGLMAIRVEGKFYLPSYLDAEAIQLFISIAQGCATLKEIQESMLCEDQIAFAWRESNDRVEHKVPLAALRCATLIEPGVWSVAGTPMEFFSMQRLN